MAGWRRHRNRAPGRPQKKGPHRSAGANNQGQSPEARPERGLHPIRTAYRSGGTVASASSKVVIPSFTLIMLSW